MATGMERGNKFGMMALSMRVIGTNTRPVVSAG